MQNTKGSWFLVDVEAGLELWQGGAGLKTNSFAVDLDGSAPASSPASSPASAPTPVATGASPGSATSRAGTCSAAYSGANTAPSSVSYG